VGLAVFENPYIVTGTIVLLIFAAMAALSVRWKV
jgi:hypothetical protein